MPYRDPEVKRQKQVEYRSKRRRQLAAQQRDYYQRTRVERVASAIRYLEAHPETARAIAFANGSNRRAKRWNPTPAKLYARDLLVHLPLTTCSYCPEAATTWDHYIPLCRGGTNALSNLRPACEPCNRRKGRRMPT